MNNIIQNILVIVAIAFAILFLVKKFLWKKKSPKKSCDDGCGCS